MESTSYQVSCKLWSWHQLSVQHRQCDSTLDQPSIFYILGYPLLNARDQRSTCIKHVLTNQVMRVFDHSANVKYYAQPWNQSKVCMII